MAEYVISLQQRTSRQLGRLERRMSLVQKKAALALFIAISTAYCAFVLGKALFGAYPGTPEQTDFGAHLPVEMSAPEAPSHDTTGTGHKLFNRQ